MEWYKKLSRQQKANIRECFEITCGISLNNALKFFTFSECMDIFYNKFKREGFAI